MATDAERATAYVGVFISAATRWRDFVPVDAAVHGETVRIGSVLLERDSKGRWSMDLGTECVWFGGGPHTEVTAPRAHGGLSIDPSGPPDVVLVPASTLGEELALADYR